MTTLYVQSPTLYQASSGNIVGATSITLTSLTDIYGNVLTMSDFGGLGYFTCEPDTTNSEGGTFTGVTANANGTYTLTGVKTMLAKSPYTQTSGLVRQHSGGTKVVITDNVGFWDTFLNKNNDSTVLGKITLTSTQKMIYDASPTLTDDKEVATKKYVDDVAIAGAPDASTTVKGIVEEATQAEVLAKTATGSTGARLFVNPSTLASTLLSDYKADTGSANAYVITPAPAITAYTAGQVFSFKATNANTTTSTLNVNGLGVKTIKKGAGSTDLASGDIAAGMIVQVEYDGTNFVMLNPVANAPTVTLTTDIQIFSTAATANWTKPTGAKWVEVTAIGGGGGGGAGSGGAVTGGGGGGSYAYKRFSASALGTTESYTVGAGGAGGTQAGTNTGTSGGFSSFGTTVLLKAPGGTGGSAIAGAGGVIGNGEITYAGGAGNTSGGGGVDTANIPSPRGGGAGGYNGGSPATATAGGAGGSFITNYVKAGGAGGASGVNNGVAASATSTGLIYGGVGGGGGGYNGNGTNTGGNGGAGNLGGGGGGANGTGTSGGAGGDGMVVVVTYF